MKTAFKFTLIPVVLALGGQAWAQLPEVWASHYTNGGSYARAAIVDSNGNIYITGSSDNAIGTVKFDPSGTLAWSASYSGQHGGYADGANALTVDAAGNVYVTGAATGNRFWYFSGTYKTYLTDCATVKYDSTGRQKWVSSYSESSNLHYSGRALAVDNTGNVYVAGSSFIIKYAPNGHQSWLTGGYGVALALDSAGNLYVTGSGTTKLDANGNQLWSVAIGGSALILDGEGGLYVTGGDTTKKLDPSSGAELWSANRGGNALGLDAGGNLFVVGPNGGGLGSAKFAPTGTNLWVANTYNLGYSQNQGAPAGVALDSAGNAYVTGLMFGGPLGSTYLTLKYGPNGNPLWIGRHAGTGAASVGLDGAGNVYVGGSDAGAYLALKYSQPVATGMPQIQTQPQKRLAFLGDTVPYSVTASGHGALNYQWYFRGSVLAGATNSALNVTNVGAYSIGFYSVEIGDALGLTLSTQAELVVVAPPASQSVLAGDSVEFDAWTFGSAPVTYQWQFNRVDLPGRTDLSLALPHVTAAQAGDYQVVASAFGNSITSSPAHLAVETLVGQNWVVRYDNPGNGEDRPNAMKVDAAGNVYVTGFSSYAYGTVKYNSDGRQLWAARYGNGSDEAWALALDRLGNVYVTGRSLSTNGYPDWDATTIKYGPNGTPLWVARYASSGNLDDSGQAITVDDTGNVYVASYSSSSNGFDYVTVKYASNGNQLWAARYDGPAHENDLPHDIAIDAAGNVYVTGESGGIGSSADYATLKYASNGNLLWAARYNGPSDSTDYGFRLAVDSTGNVYVSGASIGSGTGYDIATLKYDSNGQQLWLARYAGAGSGDDQMRALALDNTGNVYVTGWASFTDSALDYVTMKYAPNGQRLWLARYDGPSHADDTANALALDLAGNIYVTGSSLTTRLDSYGNFVGDNDFATIKYDSSGQQLWVARFDGSSHYNDLGMFIGLDGAANVYVTGYNYYDYVTVKYTQAANDSLTITGPTGFSAGGQVGGPFSVTVKTFALANQGTTTLGWQAASDASWLSVSPTGGVLATNQAPVTVTISLNSSASNLNAGFYSATVWFTNTSNGYLQLRQFALAIAQTSYGGAVLGLTPPAYWPLNENIQPPPANVVTNVGLLGTAGNGFGLASPLQGQPGIIGQCIRFSNPNLDVGYFGSHVDVPHHQALNPSGPFSVELWAKPARAVSDLFCAAASVDSSLNETNSRFGWILYQTASTWEFRVGSLNGYVATNGGGSPLIGAWNHLVGVYDGANISLYVNGQLVNGPSAAAGFAPNTNYHIPLRLGATTFPNRSFDGWLDEVAFYTNALSASRISAHFNTASNNPSGYAAQVLSDHPAGYWHLNEPPYAPPGALPIAVNLGFLRSEVDGTYQPGCLPGVPGAPSPSFGASNSACRLNGSGYLDIPGSLLDFTGPLTLVLWTKAEPANGNIQSIAGKGSGSYRLWLDGSGHPHFADGGPEDLVGSGRIDDGAWHQLAGVYDGANSKSLYVDGQLAASSSASGAVAGNGNDFLIGSNPDVALFQLFNGVVDEVCIFTNALSSAQVQTLFAAGANVPPSPVFQSITRNGGALILTWSAVAGRLYQVQYKTALTQSNWNNLGTAITATNTTASASDVIIGSQRFYRVALLP